MDESQRELRFREYYQLLNKWLRVKIYKKDICEYFNANNYKKIVIYGMGEIGKRLYDDLIENELIEIKYFIDNGKKAGYNGIEVFRTCDELPEDIDVIIVTVTWAMEDILKELNGKIQIPIVPINEVIDAMLPQKIIPFLVVSVGQACNFRCKDCGTMAPYSPSEFKRYPIENIINDLKNILNHVDFIERLQIQGGEPFLYTDLGALIDFLGQQPQVREVAIATNGSIMPSDEMLGLIKKYKIEIRISDYGLLKKSSNIKCKCDEYGIRVWYYAFTNGKGLWYSKGLEVHKEEDDEVVAKRFRACDNNVCLTLERGKVTYCSRAANAYAIQGFDMNSEDSCVIDGRKSLGEDLMHYINQKHPMEACRYCYGSDSSRLIAPAQQLDSIDYQNLGNTKIE